jgi:copper ion binding protein
MKILSIVLISLVFAFSCNNGDSTKQIKKAAEYVQVELQVDGMTCTGCEKTIEANVNKLDGIESIKADHEAGKAILSYDKANVDIEAIKKVMADKGYTVTAVKKIESDSKD